MPEFDPFKQALAERINDMQERLHGLTARTEEIRERVWKPEKHLVPKLNILYDSQRTPNGWRYTADVSVIILGQAIAAGLNTVPVTLPTGQTPNWRLEQWPNGVSLYLVVNGYFFSQRASVATAGTVIHQFQLGGGLAVAIAGSQTNTAGVDFVGDVLIPQPVTDTGNPNIGNLLITLSPGATSVTADIFINLGAAYLLPSSYGYELREDVPTPVNKAIANGHIAVEGTYLEREKHAV